jgi:hypothetical protein
MNRAVEIVVPELLSQSKRAPARLNNARLFASWQSGPETLSGFSQWKLRLELTASPPWENHEGKIPREHVIPRRAQRIVLRVKE